MKTQGEKMSKFVLLQPKIYLGFGPWKRQGYKRTVKNLRPLQKKIEYCLNYDFENNDSL